MWQNVRFGVRMFVKSPGISALVLITLALGIGVNTTLFSVVNSVLLRPLPYEHPDRIVQVSDLFPATGSPITSSLPKYRFLREHAQSFDVLGAFSGYRFQISRFGQASAAEVDGARVSANFFRVFGVRPALGRAFAATEEEPGSPSVAIISNRLWQNRFGSDPAVTGKTIGVNGEPSTIIGVMPANFDFPAGTDVWIPGIYTHATITPLQIQRGASYLLFFARLAGKIDLAQAQAELSVLSRGYDESHKGFGDANRQMRIDRLRESLVSDIRTTLLVLLGAAGFVLLIASANIANLLLARTVGRQKEMAVRASLGASKSQLIRQLLTESLVLSGAGAFLGILISIWTIGLVPRVVGNFLPRATDIQIDAVVLIVTAVIAVFTGILFGLAPAIHAARIDLNDALKASGRGFSGGGRLRGSIIVAEVALAMVLLAGAGLLLRSFMRLQSVDPGFRPADLYTMRIGLASGRYPERTQQAAYWERVLELASATPGVQSAAVANALPVNGRAIGYFFNIEGRPQLEPSKAPTFWLSSISPEYFGTMGVPLLSGRPFSAADTDVAHPVGIINQGMAQRFWPNESPIGRHVIYARESIVVEIVGVAADVKVGDLSDNAAYNQMYVPFRQRPYLTMSLIARGPESAAADVRRAILASDPDQPIAAIRTMNDVIANSLSTPRLRTVLIGSFAGLALFLALIGIGGVAAWSVSTRTTEIGLRMALGAQPAYILAMLARESLTLILGRSLCRNGRSPRAYSLHLRIPVRSDPVGPADFRWGNTTARDRRFGLMLICSAEGSPN